MPKPSIPSRKRAIVLFCRECTGWQRGMVAKCTAFVCPLYPWRKGLLDAEGFEGVREPN